MGGCFRDRFSALDARKPNEGRGFLLLWRQLGRPGQERKRDADLARLDAGRRCDRISLERVHSFMYSFKISQ